LPYGSDESTEVHGKWTDNVLVFYGYDVIASALCMDYAIININRVALARYLTAH